MTWTGPGVQGRAHAGGLGRRGFLAGAAALAGSMALAACSSASPTSADADADAIAVRAQVADAEAALIAQYATTVAAFPELAAGLQPILREHQAHLAAMGTGLATDASTPVGQPPATAAQALIALADAERTAAQQRREACVAASDGELARILALIAASEAAHVPALGEIRA
ncbi:MAG: hypothetical protein KGP12_11250 [Actinomycetales bacterium]|nr:hypothetical protein [Actinomycetales bacterium]